MKQRLLQSFFIMPLIIGIFAQPFLHASGNSEVGTGTLTTGADGITQNSKDQFRLGWAYERGEGVPRSYEQAGIWYRKSADQGNPQAMHNLGVLLLLGMGTQKDAVAGYLWIRKAAEAGDPASAFLTGKLLLKGVGVPRNTQEAVSWLRKAADAGNADALARLGQDTYFGDDGIKKDPKAALPLIRAAAEKGNRWACDTMGILYIRGELVPKDLRTANSWLIRGSHAGPPSLPPVTPPALQQEGPR